jgi:hypothetical protein
MRWVGALIGFSGAIYSGACIWFPRLRGKWKTPDATVGTASCVGAAIFSLNFGLACVDPSLPSPHGIGYGLIAFASWTWAAGGYAVDMYRASEERDLRNAEFGCALVAFGILLFIVTAVIFLFAK